MTDADPWDDEPAPGGESDSGSMAHGLAGFVITLFAVAFYARGETVAVLVCLGLLVVLALDVFRLHSGGS